MNALATNTAFQRPPLALIANPTETLGEKVWLPALQDAEARPWPPSLALGQSTLPAWLLAKNAWSRLLADRLSEVAALPEGWDGYDGKPVSLPIVQFACDLVDFLYLPGLPAPQLVPGGDGTLQLEWHVNQYDLEIDILAPCQLAASLHDLESGKEEELEVETDLGPLVGWVRRLRQQPASAPQLKG